MPAKWDIQQAAMSNKAFTTVTACNAGWYLENFRVPELAQAFGGFPLVEDKEGYLTWEIPHWGGPDRVPWISVADDYGDMVHGVFLNPEKWKGRTLQGVSDINSFGGLVEEFEKGVYAHHYYLDLGGIIPRTWADMIRRNSDGQKSALHSFAVV